MKDETSRERSTEKPVTERLAKKFKSIPKWAEDFSVDSLEDTDISKRDFIRFLSLVSFGLFTGMLGVFLKSFFHRQRAPVGPMPAKIIDRNDLGIGDSYVFQIPGRREPAILVRLGENQYVAYSQKCTHLQCPVMWRREESRLVCPCHKGAFSIQTGAVLYGPPERALTQIKLVIRPDGIYCVGVNP